MIQKREVRDDVTDKWFRARSPRPSEGTANHPPERAGGHPSEGAPRNRAATCLLEAQPAHNHLNVLRHPRHPLVRERLLHQKHLQRPVDHEVRLLRRTVQRREHQLRLHQLPHLPPHHHLELFEAELAVLVAELEVVCEAHEVEVCEMDLGVEVQLLDGNAELVAVQPAGPIRVKLLVKVSQPLRQILVVAEVLREPQQQRLKRVPKRVLPHLVLRLFKLLLVVHHR
mmetsp:Transcript_53460/g.141766  ORF Transcript_53460/g.141766 Transcript_53460/m.141766 type:complete len:227 (+) Transcript_53460:183-863(+)